MKRNGKDKVVSEADMNVRDCVLMVQRGNPLGYVRMLEYARGGNVNARREFIAWVMTERLNWTGWEELEQWGLELLEVIPGDAYYMLGCLYMPGMPGFSNLKKSEEYFVQGSALGSVECSAQLGILYWNYQHEQHELVEIRCLMETGLQACEDLTLLIHLADICEAQGDEKGEMKYLQKWRRLEPLNPEVNRRIGNCYASGRGCCQSYELALKHYMHAAREDDADALFYVGMYYLNGNGTRRNTKLAADYLQRAVDAGSGKACHALAGCYLSGNGVEPDDDMVNHLLELGIKRKNSECCLEVALDYIEGVVVERDLDKAEELLKMGASYMYEWEREEMEQQIEKVSAALWEARRDCFAANGRPDYGSFVDAMRNADGDRMGELVMGFLKKDCIDIRSLFCAMVALDMRAIMQPRMVKEIRALVRAAGESDAELAVFVGDMYYHGRGMIRNARSAENFYKRAWFRMESADVALRLFLGCHEQEFSGGILGTEGWIARLSTFASHDARVPYLFGLLYSDGLYVTQDLDYAAICFAEAEKLGHKGNWYEDLVAWQLGQKSLRVCVLGEDDACGLKSIDIDD